MHSFTCALPKCSAAFDTNNELWSHMTVAHPGMSNCPASLLGVVGSAAAVLSPRHLEVSPHHPPRQSRQGQRAAPDEAAKWAQQWRTEWDRVRGAYRLRTAPAPPPLTNSELT